MKNKITIKILAVICAAAFLAGCSGTSSYKRLEPSISADVRSFKGFQYVPLMRVCDAYGLECNWDTYTRTATVTDSTTNIVLRTGSNRILVDGDVKKISRPVILSNGTVYVPVIFVKNNLRAKTDTAYVARQIEMIPTVPAAKLLTINTIVLDSGHGGKDPGAVGKTYGTIEKDLALKLAKKIKAILERNGLNVILTRSGDTFISLGRRAAIANKSNADLFISVHINASKSRSLKGFECYYLSNATDDNARALQAFEDASLEIGDNATAERSSQLDKTLWDMALTENRMESAELASYICESVERSNVGITNRGVRSARFYVLKNTNIPSVLVEAGYLSNKSDEAKLRNPATLDKMAEAIAQGILRYKQRYEQTGGFTNV